MNRGRRDAPIRKPAGAAEPGAFTFCRLQYRRVRMSGEDDRIFHLFSPSACAVGINVILYALTH